MNTFSTVSQKRLQLMIILTGAIATIGFIISILALQVSIQNNTALLYLHIGIFYIMTVTSAIIGIMAFIQYFKANLTKGTPVIAIVLVLCTFLIIALNWETIIFLKNASKNLSYFYSLAYNSLSYNEHTVALAVIYFLWIIFGFQQVRLSYRTKQAPLHDDLEHHHIDEDNASSTMPKKRKPLPLIIGFGIVVVAFICLISKDSRIEVNPFIDCEVETEGENGDGYADVYCETDYTGNNRSINRFLNQLTYRIEDNGYLANGDSVLVTLDYDPITYDQLGIKFTQLDDSIIIDGLSEYFDKASDIPASVLQLASALANEEMEEELYFCDKYDFSTLSKSDKFKMEAPVVFKQYFIKSKYYASDEILYLYKIDGSGEINGETIHETIYYATSVDDVTTSISAFDNYVYAYRITRDDNEPLKSEEEAITQILFEYDKMKVEEIK